MPLPADPEVLTWLLSKEAERLRFIARQLRQQFGAAGETYAGRLNTAADGIDGETAPSTLDLAAGRFAEVPNPLAATGAAFRLQAVFERLTTMEPGSPAFCAGLRAGAQELVAVADAMGPPAAADAQTLCDEATPADPAASLGIMLQSAEVMGDVTRLLAGSKKTLESMRPLRPLLDRLVQAAQGHPELTPLLHELQAVVKNILASYEGMAPSADVLPC